MFQFTHKQTHVAGEGEVNFEEKIFKISQSLIFAEFRDFGPKSLKFPKNF